jgi:hypothetical protein
MQPQFAELVDFDLTAFVIALYLRALRLIGKL